MGAFRDSLLVLFATPLYAILIGLEILMSYLHNEHYYTFKDTLTNVYLSLLNMGLDIAVRLAGLAFLAFFFQFRLLDIRTVWIYWLALFIGEDFMYYLLHLVDHKCRFFWAVHVTHHSSQKFNLTTGFRSSVFQPLYRYFYFAPLAIFGFHPIDIIFIYALTQIYGILVHTEYVGKLKFLEYFLVTPSLHRVHHASNVRYLDKNMGMVLIIWDRLFGTFAEEDETEPVVYGLTKNLERPHHPVKVVFHEWQAILHDLRKAIPWRRKLGYVFKAPGWSHDGSSKTAHQMQQQLIMQETAELVPIHSARSK